MRYFLLALFVSLCAYTALADSYTNKKSDTGVLMLANGKTNFSLSVENDYGSDVNVFHGYRVYSLTKGYVDWVHISVTHEPTGNNVFFTLKEFSQLIPHGKTWYTYAPCDSFMGFVPHKEWNFDKSGKWTITFTLIADEKKSLSTSESSSPASSDIIDLNAQVQIETTIGVTKASVLENESEKHNFGADQLYFNMTIPAKDTTNKLDISFDFQPESTVALNSWVKGLYLRHKKCPSIGDIDSTKQFYLPQANITSAVGKAEEVRLCGVPAGDYYFAVDGQEGSILTVDLISTPHSSTCVPTHFYEPDESSSSSSTSGTEPTSKSSSKSGSKSGSKSASTSETSESSSSSSSGGGGLGGGAIAGIVIAIIVVVLIIAGAAFFFWRRNQQSRYYVDVDETSPLSGI